MKDKDRPLTAAARSALRFSILTLYALALFALLALAGAPSSILALWGTVVICPTLAAAFCWYQVGKLGWRRRGEEGPEGEDDGGGGGGGDRPRPPSGGDDFDWPRFEAQFHNYVQAHKRSSSLRERGRALTRR